MKKILIIILFVLSITSIVLGVLILINPQQTEEQTIETVAISNGVKAIIQSSLDEYEIAIINMQYKMSQIESIEDKKEWFIAYKEIIQEYQYILDPPETIYDYFTEEEILLICRVVETETYDQDFIPKVNVANTVLSRYWDGRFGDTIQEIVTNPKQFVYGRKQITESTILAVEYAFMFETDYEGSLYFQSSGYMETFNEAEYMGFDGCHYFYK